MSKIKTILTQASPMFKKYTHLGMVSGNVVRSRNVIYNVVSGIQSVFGMEMDAMTDLNQDNRKWAHERMLEEAERLGASHVVNVRYQVNSVGHIGQETFAYGDAIKLDIEPIKQKKPIKELEGGGPWGGAKIVPPVCLM